MSEWISMKDRQPEHDTLVITFTPPHIINIQWYWILDDGPKWSMLSRDNPLHNMITHWMPIPNPPEEI